MRKRRIVIMRKEGSQGSSSTEVVLRVQYKECQKNHAANIGGYAVDGCREFMARGDGPTAVLSCAACGCHRNFHRREVESEVVSETSSPS